MEKTKSETTATLVQLPCPKGHVHNFIVFSEDRIKYEEATLVACPYDDEPDDDDEPTPTATPRPQQH